MALVLELQKEFTELKKRNVEEMEALKEENARIKIKLEETEHEKSQHNTKPT